MTRARHSRRRDHSEDAHDEPDERWAVSYADMVTVLMCLFIVLFAVSNVDKGKYEELAGSLAAGFGQEDLGGGAVGVAELVLPSQPPSEEADLERRAALEYDSLEELERRMRSALTAEGLENTVDFVIDDRGLTAGLVGAETFFANNSTALSETAGRVLDTIGGVLGTVDNQLAIEGHADYRNAVAPFPTNWELSGGRATEVVRYLAEQEQIAGERLRATGFSDTRPVADGDSAEALAANRRVDIVVESRETDAVRELIPSIERARNS